MAWDFSTDPEFQQKLDWMTEFVQTEIEPLDLAFSSHLVYDKDHPVHEKVVRPLQDEVRARDLWACHLGPDLGGKGYGQLKLALMNEILAVPCGRRACSGRRRPTRGTPRSSPITAPRSRRRSTSSRSSTAASRPATR